MRKAGNWQTAQGWVSFMVAVRTGFSLTVLHLTATLSDAIVGSPDEPAGADRAVQNLYKAAAPPARLLSLLPHTMATAR